MYAYQPYPKVLYNREGQTLVVADHAAHAEAGEEWAEEPFTAGAGEAPAEAPAEEPVAPAAKAPKRRPAKPQA